jgi:demethylmenaquinone methyltransferase/2-methoxy-6-polyprenyl-1,4-benzoquinol methylase
MISTDPSPVSPSESLESPSPPAWDDALLRNPHAVADKRRRVRQMFAAIAPSYDLNNRLHSLWQDQRWRRQAVKMARLKPEDVVVDVACGTGDLTLKYAALLGWLLGEPPATGQVIGVDFTFEMLPLARQKALRRRRKVLSERCDPEVMNALRGSGPDGERFCADLLREPRVLWINGDAQALPLPDACCDVVSIAFGIRNVSDPAAAVREFYRVLRPGGRLVILEFSLPTRRVLRALYNFYFRHVLPHTATLISGDRTGAYKYLPESVNTFIGREQMEQMMREAGFDVVKRKAMTFGVCVCYRGIKG